jgi:hypothetical protein
MLLACKKEKSAGDPVMSDFSINGLNRPSFVLDVIFTDETNRVISLLFANPIPQDSLPLTFFTSFSLTSGATSDPASGEMITVNDPDEAAVFTLTAEDGHQVSYLVMVRDNQLPNRDFEDWYTADGMNGVPYLEPGIDAESTVWSTANKGTSMYAQYGTLPVTEGDNTVVQIITGETTLVPITAGTIFTGRFDVNAAITNPTDPEKATILGIPFSLHPSAFKFKYTFVPGIDYIQATPNDPSNIFGGFTVIEIPGEDEFTAYSILEKRNSGSIVEVGRAEFFSGVQQTEFTEVTVPFNYTISQKPTHISVVFSSSRDGALFTGAVGSTLIIDDLELIYE